MTIVINEYEENGKPRLRDYEERLIFVQSVILITIPQKNGPHKEPLMEIIHHSTPF